MKTAALLVARDNDAMKFIKTSLQFLNFDMDTLRKPLQPHTALKVQYFDTKRRLLIGGKILPPLPGGSGY